MLKLERLENAAGDFHLLSCMISDGIFPKRIFIDSDDAITNPYSTAIVCFEYRSDLKVYHKKIQARIEFCDDKAPLSFSESLAHLSATGSLPLSSGIARQFTQLAEDFYSPADTLRKIQSALSTLSL